MTSRQRVLASLAAVLAWGTAAPAQASLERVRTVVERGAESELLDAVREHPVDARELVRALLAESSERRDHRADSTLAFAHRAAAAYARAWSDSFPFSQVRRFARLTRSERARWIAIDSVRRAGNDLLGRAGVDAALVVWRRALQMASIAGDSGAMAAALGNVGSGYFLAGDLDSAEAHLTRARDLAAEIGDRRTMANALVTLGSVSRDRGDLSRARALHSRALELHSSIGDAGGVAADRNNIGLLSASLGDLDEARAQYEASLALARRHGLDGAAATALLNLGNVSSTEGDFAGAARRYLEALAIHRKGHNAADAALVLHNLGLLELRRGDYVAARERLSEALAIFTKTGTIEDRIAILRDLATVAAASGDLRSAMAQLRQGDVLAQRADADPSHAAGIALARADLSIQLNLYSEAERWYARAEAMYRAAGDAAGQAEAQVGRGILFAERKRYDRALELLRGASRVQAASGDRRASAITRLLVGSVQHHRGDLAAARGTFEQVVESLRLLGDAVGEAAALSALADVEGESGAPLAAEALYRRGLTRLEGRAAPTVAWQLHSGLGRVLHMRGALADASGELRAAIAHIEQMAGTLAAVERRTTFLADKWEVYSELALVERERDAGAAFAVSERLRARQMLSLLDRGKVRGAGTADTVMQDRAQDLRRRIGELTKELEEEAQQGEMRGADLSGGTSSSPTRESLARLQEQYAQVRLALRDDDTGPGSIMRDEVTSWRDVARRLRRDEALVEYLVSDSTTLAFVITSDSLRVVNLGVDRDALESLIDFSRGALSRPAVALRGSAAPSWRAPLRRLHEHLVAPLEVSGALNGARRLIIVPHAELHYLPFAALVGTRAAGGADQFLIERYDIAYAPSASVWLRLGDRQTPVGAGVLAVAPRTQTLPGSREEVLAIRALYGSPATVLTNAAATEGAFRASAPQFAIVHLATYGVLNKHNPLFSYVALNPSAGDDGRLEVHEVFGMNMSARLVVLSACQTALASGSVSDVPAGDDWVGLVRAFLGVGVANVIATLWPVEDRSSAALMTQLHTELRANISERAALNAAQRAALRNPATSDPFYWAGFVLVGGR